MKFLFDENLSDRLVERLAALGQHLHVKDAGLIQSDDESIWKVAKADGWTIVSKDADFSQRALVRGHPPKVITLRVGNVSTERIAILIEQRQSDIDLFLTDDTAALLVLAYAE